MATNTRSNDNKHKHDDDELFQAIKKVVKRKMSNDSEASQATILEEEETGLSRRTRSARKSRTRRGKFSTELKKVEVSCLRQLLFSFGLFKTKTMMKLLHLAFPKSNSDFSFSNLQAESLNIFRKALCELYCESGDNGVKSVTLSGDQLREICVRHNWKCLAGDLFGLISNDEVYTFEDVSIKYSYPSAMSLLDVLDGWLCLQKKHIEFRKDVSLPEGPVFSEESEAILNDTSTEFWNLSIVLADGESPLTKLDSSWEVEEDMFLLKAAFLEGNFCTKKFHVSKKSIVDSGDWSEERKGSFPTAGAMKKRVKEILRGLSRDEIRFTTRDKVALRDSKGRAHGHTNDQLLNQAMEEYRTSMNAFNEEEPSHDTICYILLCLKRYGCPSVKDIPEHKGNLTWREFRSHLKNATNRKFDNLATTTLKLYSQAIIRHASELTGENVDQELFFPADTVNIKDLNWIRPQIKQLNLSIVTAQEVLRSIDFLYKIRHVVLPKSLAEISGMIFNFNARYFECNGNLCTFSWWRNPDLDFAAFACLALNGCSKPALRNVMSTFSLNPVVNSIISTLNTYEQQEFYAKGINFTRLYHLANFICNSRRYNALALNLSGDKVLKPAHKLVLELQHQIQNPRETFVSSVLP